MKYTRVYALLGLLISVLGLSSCDNTLDTDAPRQEVAAFYGFINPDSLRNYVRINKGFQNAGRDARDMALNDRSASQYGSGIIRVEVFQDSSRGPVRVATAVEETNTRKLAGEFYSAEQILYRINFRFRDNKRYFIRATNTQTGYQMQALLPMIGDAKAIPFSGDLSTVPDFSNINSDPNYRGSSFNFPISQALPPTVGQRMEFYSACNTGFMRVDMEIAYKEYYGDPNTTVITDSSAVKRFMWENCIPTINSGLSGNECNRRLRNFTITSQGFIQTLLANIAPAGNNVVRRSFQPANLTLTISSPEFSRYVTVNNSFNSLSQTQPLFTNVENGLGLVTSRRIFVGRYSIDAATSGALGSNNAQPAVRALRFR